jgi:hypothetical protein
MFDLWSFAIAVVVGVVLGVAALVTFVAVKGVNIPMILTDATTATLVGTVVALAAGAVLVRDGTYPRANPGKFTLEVALMSTLPVVPLVVMDYFRGLGLGAATWGEAGVLAAKFGLLHVLLQYSGVYGYVLSA